MIVLNINGFEIVGRIPKRLFSGNMEKIATPIKREMLISAFQQMPDEVVNEIWLRALRDTPRLELMPRNEAMLGLKEEKE